MEIVLIEPTDNDVYIRLKLKKNLLYLQQYLGRCTCKYDANNDPFMIEAAAYIEGDFMNGVNDIIEKNLDTQKYIEHLNHKIKTEGMNAKCRITDPSCQKDTSCS